MASVYTILTFHDPGIQYERDWKYALGLDLTDAGFDFSILSEFRARLLAGEAVEQTVPSRPLLWWGVRTTLPCKPQPDEEPRRENEKGSRECLQVHT